MRNPFAFRSKIANPETKEGAIHESDILTQGKSVLKELSAVAEVASPENSKRHFKGCNCRRSGCQKKYCECFQQGVICSDLCKCEGCKNCETSKTNDE